MTKTLRAILFALSSLDVASMAPDATAQDRGTKVRNDRERVEGDGFWIYNDLPRGLQLAKESGRPLLVVIRCIPCEACAQLDAQVVRRDPALQRLLEKFVCVRIINANGLDLSLFQYDYDQSFAAFFLNTDQTIYGRYGTRSHETESDRDVSVEGFAKALAAALELHERFAENKALLAAKHGLEPLAKAPEELPALKGKYGSRINYEGNVVQSCIHCHQVGEAMRLVYRAGGRAIPEKLLYPYPLPSVLGLVMDPHERARVRKVEPGSSAERDGWQAGDEIVNLEGQPVLSIADLQWVLHNAGDAHALTAEVVRGSESRKLPLSLGPGWRQRGDISWRATSWDLRRMTTGGMRLDDLSTEARRSLGLDDDVLALRARHVGEYGEHATAKNAGFRKGDVLVEVNGSNTRLSESQLMTWLVNAKRPGERVAVVVLRDGARIPLELPMQ
ncbi:MAG TPA: Trx7/PDZ domain-containing (seleno)protein [Pirellulales bacterium]|nr:Trx7/PDZ domain-containing (seleno)protein [Pirellulales bacterium]